MSTIAPVRPPQTESSPKPVAPPPGSDAPKRGIWMAAAASFLSTAAAAWMAGGIFDSQLARVVGLSGSALAVALIVASQLGRRSSMLQYAVLPASLVAGALVVLPDLTGGSANLVGLVAEAVTTGGLNQPPVPFDPGWRFLMLVIFALLGAASATVSLGIGKVKLGAFIPLPVVIAASLTQPPENEVLSSSIAIALLIASQTASFGTELADKGVSSTAFETRRLLRGGFAVLLVVAVVAGLSKADFLFPAKARSQVIPPQRPKSQPLSADRVVFTAISERPGPWRLGVLDSYDGKGWLLPPYDTERLMKVSSSSDKLEKAETFEGTQKTTFLMSDIEGHSIPGVATPLSVTSPSQSLTYDPRTQAFRTAEGRASKGLSYTITSPVPPGGNALSAAPAPSAEMQPFLQAPPAPNEVLVLLREAPENRWDRLQYVRAKFYEKVVAAGAGAPIDVLPSRVVEMMTGNEGTPFEITASEALLARWAGIPARIGYGYYSGDKKDNRFEVHPRHGATWLEVNFAGHGWVPVVGVPPRARASLDQQKQNADPNVQPTDELALIVYVPVQRTTIRLLYVYVRYWLAIATPFAAGALLLWWGLPAFFKVLRRRKRKKWAKNDPAARILVAYSEFRDSASDLALHSNETPLDFLDRVSPDEEHAELAWLTTRGLWGDLARDLNSEDAEAAEQLATSVTSRMRKAQPALTRLLAIGSRTSLQDPYSPEVPNLWPSWARKGAIRARFPRKILRRLLPFSLLVVLLAISGCSTAQSTRRTGRLPEKLVPDSVQGLEVRREPSAEKGFIKAGPSSLVREGRVYTLRNADTVEASLQFGAFKPAPIAGRERELRRGLLKAIGTGRFEVGLLADERVYTLRTVDQKMILWLSDDSSYYQLMVATASFADSDRVFLDVLRFRDRESNASTILQFDPRRGGEA